MPLEAFIAQGAAHPGVLRVFGTSAQPGQPIWMLLEYCDLGTLQVRALCTLSCTSMTRLNSDTIAKDRFFGTSAQPGQPIWMLLEYCDLGTLQVQTLCTLSCSSMMRLSSDTLQKIVSLAPRRSQVWMLLEYCDLGTLQVQPRERSVSAILHVNDETV